MAVREIPPSDAGGRRSFIKLERSLIGSFPRHVPELGPEVRKHLAGRSPYYEEMEWTLFVASDGRDVARCAAFVNRRWQRDRRDPAGFFGYFAAAPGAERPVVEMLERAEAWLSAKGASRVIAPVNGAMFHGGLVLTSAFEEDPVFPFPWTPPYYPAYFETAGYRPTYPLWIYDIDFSSEQYRTISKSALEHPLCTVRPIDKKKWKSEIETYRGIFNEGFRNLWEFHQITLEEFLELYNPMKPILDPRQLLFAEVDGEPVGICLGSPDFTPLFRSLRGKMGPRQIIKILRGAKRYSRAGLLVIAVRDAYRGKHIGQTLAATLYRRYEEIGLKRALYYPVNDENAVSRQFAESFGGEGRILYHAYDKPLR